MEEQITRTEYNLINLKLDEILRTLQQYKLLPKRKEVKYDIDFVGIYNRYTVDLDKVDETDKQFVDYLNNLSNDLRRGDTVDEISIGIDNMFGNNG